MEHVQYEYTRIDLEERLGACVGKTLGDVDSAGVFAKTADHPKITGIAGDVVEQSVLGYAPNSAQEPDLVVDGVEIELKTTGLKRGKGRNSGIVSAKEPMSITAVSLDRIAGEEFESSTFWHKAERMLIVYYLYDAPGTVAAAEYVHFPLEGYQFHEFSEEERETLRNDWEIVRDFVRGIQDEHPREEERRELYPLLSSALRDKLMLIDTAPKYPHPPRFRLKQKTVTAIAQKEFGESFERLPCAYTSFSEIDAKLREIADRFRGMTIAQMADLLGVKYNPEQIEKNIVEQVLVAAFGGKSKKLNRVEVFAKAGVLCKSVVLRQDGKGTEDMKFFAVDFDEFGPDARFEDSTFSTFFDDLQLVCPLLVEPFKDAPMSTVTFLGFKRVSFAEDFTEKHVEKTWEQINRLLCTGELRDVVKLDKKTGQPRLNKNGVVQSAPNLPKKKENKRLGIATFLRGSGNDSGSKPLCVNGVRMYQQYVWIDREFIVGMLGGARMI